jgi:hypothetical protein
MVKNYLVGAVRPVTDNWMDQASANLHTDYSEMYQISRASFQRFVQEPFETVLWTDPVANNEEYALANWKATVALWNSGPCNIFWAGADTMMVQPTSLFSNQFSQYRLFNYTDPKTHSEFPRYFNDDLMYYPHTTKDETWDLGEQWWSNIENHPNRNWGFDQLRHNAMFWSQDIPELDILHPKLAYQAMKIRSLTEQELIDHNSWNGININSAHILHFHGSRGSQAVIAIMKRLSNHLGIKI